MPEKKYEDEYKIRKTKKILEKLHKELKDNDYIINTGFLLIFGVENKKEICVLTHNFPFLYFLCNTK